jgi:hypothetical protein
MGHPLNLVIVVDFSSLFFSEHACHTWSGRAKLPRDCTILRIVRGDRTPYPRARAVIVGDVIVEYALIYL